VLEGRTAHRVLQGAPCAVAVVPRGFGARSDPPIGVVGVGYDGTVAAQYALAVAAELSQALQSKLRLIGVFDETPFRDAELAGSDGHFEHAERQQRDHLQRMLEGALRSLPRDLDASQDLRTGQPGTVLTEAARAGLDLLVVGSQGSGPFLEVNVGSTGRELLGSAPAAVLVAPLGVPADIAGALQ
jgi:nucleotide-binding universal stress UspA family protein